MSLSRLGVARLLLVAVLLTPLGACSDDPDPQADSSPSSTSSPPSAEVDPTDDPTDDPTNEPAPEREPTNPCDLIGQADYAQLVQPGDRPFLVETPQLSTTVEPFYECAVTVNGYAFMSFGYALDEGSYARTLREEKELDDVRSLDGVGDRAFYTDTSVFPAAYADLDGQTVMFGMALLKTSRTTLAAPLQRLVENAAKQGGITVGPVLDTGEGCPTATSNAVRRVLGEVAYARGDKDLHGVPQCSYRSSPGKHTILSMGTTYYDKERFGQERAGGTFADYGIDDDADLDDDSEVLDPPPGRAEEIFGDPAEGGVTILASYPRARVFAGVHTASIGLHDQVVGSRAALRRLATAWYAAAEPAINAYRPYGDGRQPQRD